MPSFIGLSEVISVGDPVVLECPSPVPPFMVVFEDDGDTGYFYGLSRNFHFDDKTDQEPENPILDAMHIYNVQDVIDRDIPSEVSIGWSGDGLKSILFINNYPHAIFDFESHRAYCRTNFPPPQNDYTDTHEWDDRALDLFR